MGDADDGIIIIGAGVVLVVGFKDVDGIIVGATLG